MVSVPSSPTIFILSLEKGQQLVLPKEHPHGYLLAPLKYCLPQALQGCTIWTPKQLLAAAISASVTD